MTFIFNLIDLIIVSDYSLIILVSDYSLIIFALPILLLLGLLTVKYKILGDTIIGLLLLTIMIQNTKYYIFINIR